MSLLRSTLRSRTWKAAPARLRRRPTLTLMEDRLAPAVIFGFAYNDLDGSGTREAAEPGLPGATIFLDLNNNGKFDPPSGGFIVDLAVKSGSDGKYVFQVPGTSIAAKYSVGAIPPLGFNLTTPAFGTVEVNGNLEVHGPDFGAKQAPAAGGVIRGHVFNDLDGNGQKSSTEGPFGGALVYVDLNNNGMFDPSNSPGVPGEPATLSSITGVYELKLAADGKYTVAIVAPPNFTVTTAASGVVDVAGGTLAVGPTFGLKQNPPPTTGGVIHGLVFVDADGNGQKGTTEVGQPGVTVFIDLNNNGKFDPPVFGTVGEPHTLSGNNGGYELKVGVDGEYAVLEIVPPNFKQTTPTSVVKVSVAGGAVVTGPLFGNQELPPPPPTGGLIRGNVFVDLDGDGTHDTGEGPQGGVRVFLDLNNNGKWDSVGGTITLMEPSSLTGTTGHYEIKVNADGEYAVLEIVPDGFKQTAPTSVVKVAVSGGATVTGPTFGNQPPPAKGGVVHGVVFVDFNGNGTRENTEPGQPNVLVYADLNNNGKFDIGSAGTVFGETFAISNKEGAYNLRINADGEFAILERVPFGFKQTAPTSVVKVAVSGGATVTGPTFGNQPLFAATPTGKVTGRVFLDVNTNGKLDQGEPGLPGVRVYDDANNNSKFDNNERYTFSAYGGGYELRLAAGVHNVREVVPPGFVETAAPGPVTVVAGQTVADQHFGLWVGNPNPPRPGGPSFSIGNGVSNPIRVGLTSSPLTVVNPGNDDTDNARFEFHGGVIVP